MFFLVRQSKHKSKVSMALCWKSHLISGCWLIGKINRHCYPRFRCHQAGFDDMLLHRQECDIHNLIYIMYFHSHVHLHISYLFPKVVTCSLKVWRQAYTDTHIVHMYYILMRNDTLAPVLDNSFLSLFFSWGLIIRSSVSFSRNGECVSMLWPLAAQLLCLTPSVRKCPATKDIFSHSHIFHFIY